MTTARLAASAPAVSIVIPAHNEASIIGRLLDTMPRTIDAGDVEVIVACNGCTDKTAAVARSHGATVVEIDSPSKIGALNAGDGVARGYPRIYLDADISLSRRSIQDVVKALTTSSVLCAAPPFRVELAGRPWGVRAYFSIWQQLPYLRDAYVGSGVYALSVEGRRRFAQFPDVVADDLFIRNLFSRDERSTVATDPFVIQAPWTLDSLFRRRVRIDIGNLEVRRHPEFRFLPGNSERSGAWWRVVRGRPSLIPAAVWYLAVNAIAKIVARYRCRRRQPVSWARDETTRISDI